MRSPWILACVVGTSLAALGAGPANADEIISDPELEGPKAQPSASATSPVEAPPPAAPTASTGTFRLSLHTRWGVDTHWEHASQDVTEGTSVVVFEAEQRRSETLLLSVGVRARHSFARRRNGDARYELDAVPTSAFADVTLDDGLHLRAGYQTVDMGRFDLFSATNFLAAYDLRSGPMTMPEAGEIGQPALRFDVDRVSGFLFQAWFLPFFQPDLVTVYGSDYALLEPLDRAIDEGQFGSAAADVRSRLETALGRSGLSVASTNAVQALGPVPSFASPQGALRATVHGTAGELSATVGTALERLPAITFSPSFFSALLGTGGPPSTPLVAYNRFSVASIDGALDVGPIQLGLEAAFMKNRTLLAAPVSAVAPSASPTLSDLARNVALPERTDMLYGGLRAEMIESAGWAAVIEAFLTGALEDPAPPPPGGAPRQWFAFEKGRYFRGIAGGVHFAPEASRVRLELGTMVLSGPTYVVLPRFEWEALTRLYLEVGAVFVEGPAPPFFAAANTSLGGLYDDVDQVFIGAKWVP